MNAVLELRNLGADLPPVRRVLREAVVALLRAVGLVEDAPGAVQELRAILGGLDDLLVTLAALRIEVRVGDLPPRDVPIEGLAATYASAVDALDRLEQLLQGLRGLTGREVIHACRTMSPDLGAAFEARASEATDNLVEQREALSAIVDELEDRYDLEQSQRALAEPGASIPYEQVRRDLGLS